MDNFGSAYTVGGFGQGFAQGFGMMQDQQRLNIQKAQEARQQDEYKRSLAQHDIQGAYTYYDSQMDQHNQFVAGKVKDDGDVKGAWNKIHDVSQKYGVPTPTDYQSEPMAQHIKSTEQAIQDVHNGMPIHQALNKPDMIAGINYRYDEQLNHDENGKPLNETLDRDIRGEKGIIPKGAKAVKRQIMDFTPGPNGTVVPDLKVTLQWTDKNGTHYDTVADPLTEGRSLLASDSQIKGIGLDKLMDQHAFDRHMWETLNNPAIKGAMQGAYIAQGGKPEEFEPVLKKTQMDHDAEWEGTSTSVQPGTGKYFTGTLVRDYKANVLSAQGVPIEKSNKAFAAMNRGVEAAKIRGIYGGGGKGAEGKQAWLLNWLTDSYKLNNPKATPGEAREHAWNSFLTGQYKQNIGKIAEVAAKEKNLWGTDNAAKIYDDMMSDIMTRASVGAQPDQSAQQPGLGRPQSTTPQKAIVDRGVGKKGTKYEGKRIVKYEDGTIGLDQGYVSG